MNTAYQGTTHTKADTTHLVWRVFEKAQAEAFEKFIKNRPGNSRMILVLNVLLSGEKKLKSSTLATFNKKIIAMKNGKALPSELDTDTLPPPAFAPLVSEDSGE